MIVARIVRCFTTTAATLIVAVCSMLRAQDLEPRAYSNSPTGLNFVIVGYGYAKGSVLTDPSLPLDNVSNESHVGVFAYATTLNVLGKSAKFDMIVPYVSLAAKGPRLRPAARALRHGLRRSGVSLLDELHRRARADGGGVQGLPAGFHPRREPARHRAARPIRRATSS